MTNYDVMRAFLDRGHARTSNLTSDGETLWSYQMRIARWGGRALILHIPRKRSLSVTTSRHLGLVLREAPPKWLIPAPDLTLLSAQEYLADQPSEGTVPAMIEKVLEAMDSHEAWR